MASACGVCHTELDEIEGRTPPPRFPIVLGHEVVEQVVEKEIKSVANVARRDIREFLEIASSIAIKPEVEEFALEDANRALMELKERNIRGAKVLRL